MVALNPLAPIARVINRIQVDRAGRASLGGLTSTVEMGDDGLALVTGLPLLKRYNLPQGRHGSINVGHQANGAQLYIDPAAAIREGYDGVVIVGAGPDLTEVFCTAWDGQTIAIARGPWTVRIENFTLIAGVRCAVFAGGQNLPAPGAPIGSQRVEPKFQFHASNIRGLVLTPEALNVRNAEGHLGRTKWFFSGYNVDVFAINCVVDAKEASEHLAYWRGHAKFGSKALNCRFIGAGSQLWKNRSDATETAWAGPAVVISFEDCEFENWHQPHTDRGGAACVGEGSAAHWSFLRCVFKGGMRLVGTGGLPTIEANARALCIALSAEGESYDMDTGRVGVGFGTGWLIVRQTATWGHSDVPWNNKAIYVGRNGGAQWAAKGVLIEDSGLWGQSLVVQFGNIQAGKTTVRRCNTPALRDYAANVLHIPASSEVKVATANALVPLSQGYQR